jgi:hypothetical protein
MKSALRDPVMRAAIALVVAISVLTVSSPVPAAAATCSLWAEQPYYNGAINGWGHFYGCPSGAKITVVLRQDRRWWPDKTLDTKYGYGPAGSVLTWRACGNDFDPIKVFVEVRYGSQKVQSARAILPCG